MKNKKIQKKRKKIAGLKLSVRKSAAKSKSLIQQNGKTLNLGRQVDRKTVLQGGQYASIDARRKTRHMEVVREYKMEIKMFKIKGKGKINQPVSRDIRLKKSSHKDRKRLWNTRKGQMKGEEKTE